MNNGNMLIDIDGVILDENCIIDKSLLAINNLYENGYNIYFVTNNVSRDSDIFCTTIRENTLLNDVIIFSPIEYFVELSRQKSIESIMALGSKHFIERLKLEGFKIVLREISSNIDAVILSSGVNISIHELSIAANVLECGSHFFITGAEKYFRYKDQKILGTGSISKCIEYYLGVEATILGKPSKDYYKYILHQIPHLETTMIGDNYELDIVGAKNAGIRTVYIIDEQINNRFPAADERYTSIFEYSCRNSK